MPTLDQAVQALLARKPRRMVFSVPYAPAHPPGDGAPQPSLKATLRPLETGWQLERRTATQAFHQNLTNDQLPGLLAGLLTHEFRELHAQEDGGETRLRVSKRGKVLSTHTGADSKPYVGILVDDHPGHPDDAHPAEDDPHQPAHNRSKRTLLPEGEPIPALVDMGVFTPDGRVVKGKADKFRQVNRFVELADDLLRGKDISSLQVVDFGSGKATLTFVLYHYLRYIKNIDVHITGVDRKAAVVADCNRAAKRAGYTGLQFLPGDIATFQPDAPPDMVVALHACDTATDEALAKAVGWQARFILAAPCCQHELNAQMQPGPLPILTRYGVVQHRVAALMTDAIRANLLTASGYKTQLLEFVDLAHTPKNLLIRAEKANLPAAVRDKARAEAQALMDAFGFEPKIVASL